MVQWKPNKQGGIDGSGKYISVFIDPTTVKYEREVIEGQGTEFACTVHVSRKIGDANADFVLSFEPKTIEAGKERCERLDNPRVCDH